MVGAILKKTVKKLGPKQKKMLKKRNERGELKRASKVHPAEKYLSRKAVLGGAKAALMKKKPLISKTEKGIGIGVAGTLGTQAILKSNKAKKDAKAASDKKLRKSLEKHEKKTKEKRKKYGKHHYG
jgi:hypothetical protein